MSWSDVKKYSSCRVMPVAIDDFAKTVVGYHSQDRQEVDIVLAKALDSDAKVVSVTRGKRFGQQPIDPRGRKHVAFDVENLHGPGRDPSMTIHLGWTPGITERMMQIPEFMNVLDGIKGAIQDCDNSKDLDRDPMHVWLTP